MREPVPSGMRRSWAVPIAYWSALAVLSVLEIVLLASHDTKAPSLMLLIVVTGLPVLQLGASLLVMLWVAFFPSPSYVREARWGTLSRITVYGFVGAVIGAVLMYLSLFVVPFFL